MSPRVRSEAGPGPGPAPRGPVIARVERTSGFQRVLAKLHTRPGRPAEAARKAERILAALAAGEGLCTWEAGALTRFGDARVPGCVKYELGGGYRLICRRAQATLVALYVGNHEECHSWLRVSRGLDTARGEACEFVGAETDADAEQAPGCPAPVEEREYTDRELRAVFAGLCRRLASPLA